MKNDNSKYIEAILNLAEKKDQLDQILFDMISFGERIGYQSVVSGKDDQEKRKIVISNQIKSLGSEKLKKYLSNLLAKKDFWIFEPGRFKIFCSELKESASELICVRLMTAVSLEKTDLKKMTDKLGKKLGKKVLVDLTVDPTIIGGAIIHKDNYILDFSVKSKLQHLAKEWKRSIVEAHNDAPEYR